ncbi:MAG: hypothetical protein E7219_06720 [Clostridiales bacterium]|nr:hypothetical protein [Clostridiales bacterium]
MTNVKLNREDKDALFKLVFGDYPENALSLYNAINGTDYTDCDDLKITTLRDSLYIGVKNDVSFLFNHDMNLYEHQSTYCPNMPLRGLGYFADLYMAHLGGEAESYIRMYDSKLISIPAPKYYIFYNGITNEPEKLDLRLSDAYEGDGDIEITAHMLNVNAGNNTELMGNCKPLSDYSVFVDRVREYLKQGLSKEEAIEKAIDSCIEDGILEKILREERAKVENLLIRGLTEEEQQMLKELQIKDAREEGIEKGVEIGAAEANMEAVEKMIEKGRAKDAEDACEVLGVSMEDYLKWKAAKA